MLITEDSKVVISYILDMNRTVFSSCTS